MARGQHLKFHELPQNLADRILRILEEIHGMSGIAGLRLVCKAWQAVIQQYPGCAKLVSTLDNLQTLLRIMPNIDRLCMTHAPEGSALVNLTSLGQCSQLTSFGLSALDHQSKFYNGEVISVAGVPSTLREVEISNLGLDTSSFSNAAARITKLAYFRKADVGFGQRVLPLDDDWNCLQNLPHLKVGYPASSLANILPQI